MAVCHALRLFRMLAGLAQLCAVAEVKISALWTRCLRKRKKGKRSSRRCCNNRRYRTLCRHVSLDHPSLYELWTNRARLFVLLQDAEPSRDFRVGLDQAAEVTAEAILVELVVRFDVP